MVDGNYGSMETIALVSFFVFKNINRNRCFPTNKTIGKHTARWCHSGFHNHNSCRTYLYVIYSVAYLWREHCGNIVFLWPILNSICHVIFDIQTQGENSSWRCRINQIYKVPPKPFPKIYDMHAFVSFSTWSKVVVSENVYACLSLPFVDFPPSFYRFFLFGESEKSAGELACLYGWCMYRRCI